MAALRAAATDIGLALRALQQKITRALVELSVRLWEAALAVAAAVAECLVDFTRWFCSTLASLYMLSAGIVGDLVVLLRVFAPSIVPVVMYHWWPQPGLLLAAAGWVVLILVAVAFYGRRQSDEPSPRPDWATIVGHVVVSLGLAALQVPLWRSVLIPGIHWAWSWFTRAYPDQVVPTIVVVAVAAASGSGFGVYAYYRKQEMERRARKEREEREAERLWREQTKAIRRRFEEPKRRRRKEQVPAVWSPEPTPAANLCPKCGKHGDAFCEDCGLALVRPYGQDPANASPAHVHAGTCVCGARHTSGDNYCEHCGSAVGSPYRPLLPIALPANIIGTGICKCGARYGPGDECCVDCGMPVSRQYVPLAPIPPPAHINTETCKCGSPHNKPADHFCMDCGMPLDRPHGIDA